MKNMVAKISLVVIGIALSLTVYGAEEQMGEKLFRGNCASCHSIGSGALVGPDLKDVHTKRTDEWLLAWIKSPQSLLDAGDDQALKVFKEFNQIPMPAALVGEDDIKEIIEFIKSESAALGTTVSTDESDFNKGEGPVRVPVKSLIPLLYTFSGVSLILLSVIAMLFLLTRKLSRHGKTDDGLKVN